MERSIGNRTWLRWCWGVALVSAGILGGRSVGAVPAPPNAPAVTGASYTVTYQPCNCYAAWLEERAENGAWTYVGQSPLQVYGKPNGTYYYRVGNFFVSDPYFTYTWTEFSAEVRVTVGPAQGADPLTTQLGYRYETRYGDGNGDGRLDLLVNRTAGGTSGNGTLETVLLLQDAGSQFSTLVPSAAQAAVAKTWPIAPIQVVLNDFNVDGFVDVLLKSVASTIGGASNQIVYAPARMQTSQPLGLRAVDAGLKRFAANSRDYYANTDYFTQNASVGSYYQPYTYYVCYPNYYYDYYGYSNCHLYTVYYLVTYPDYSAFDPNAVNAWNTEMSIQGRSISADQGVAMIKQSYENVLGVPIGGRDLRGLAGEQGSFDDPTYRRGLELFLAVLGISDANAQELDPPRDSTRRPDVVYVTGRRVLGFLPLHTALEYAGSTLSAFDSDASLLGDGLLVSRPNAPSDAPPMMMTLGTVSSSLGAALYWGRLVLADTNYDDNLPYDAVPAAGDAGYNSNGFTHGLVQATAGTPSIDLSRFVGGEKPVPPGAFY